jgi:uncharacterized protein (TIGR02145 family)
MVDIRGFNGGLNMDAGPELLPNGDYTYAMNLENTAEGIVNLPGNRILEGAPPPTSGSEWVCGSFFDRVRQRIIYFTNNIAGYHRIISVDVLTEEHVVLYEDSVENIPSQVPTTETRSFNITASTIHILGDNLLLDPGETFSISGSASNNGTLTVVSHNFTTSPLFPNSLVNIITVTQPLTAEVGSFSLTYTRTVSTPSQAFDWPRSPNFNPNYLIKDVKVIHREYEGDLYYFIDPNKKLKKFNYNTIRQQFVVGESNLCAYGWTDGNYDGTVLRDGSAIPQVTSASAWANMTTPAWCYVNNDPNTNSDYGKLYNWYAISHPLFAPVGYRVPSATDWGNLITCLGGVFVAGGKLKSSRLWTAPNTGATNESRFDAVPAGVRLSDGTFSLQTLWAAWWNTTQVNATSAYLIYVTNTSQTAFNFLSEKNSGFSVRLIKV